MKSLHDTSSYSPIAVMLSVTVYRLIATGNDDGSIRWWNPASGSTITLRHHKNTVSCMCTATLKRNVYLISGGFDGAVGIWDITNRRSVNPRLEYMFKAHTGRVENDAIMGYVFLLLFML